jgi:hypothetical protein
VLTATLAFDRREGALVAREGISFTAFTGLIRDFDRVDEAFEIRGGAEVVGGSFRMAEISGRTAAFLRVFFDGFIARNSDQWVL